MTRGTGSLGRLLRTLETLAGRYSCTDLARTVTAAMRWSKTAFPAG